MCRRTCVPPSALGPCWCIDQNFTVDPLFVDPGDPSDGLETFEFNNYRLRFPDSLAIDSGDPEIEPFDNAVYFPFDDFDVDGDTEFTEVTPAIGSDRVLELRLDRGAYERPCLLPGCLGDFVTSLTFLPPPDGEVDGADLAFLVGEWGPNPGSLADIVTNATFLPPPDGEVDGADLAVLLGAWGMCPCADPYAQGMMMGGGEGMFGGGEGAATSGDPESPEGTMSSGPFEGTDLGAMLDELMATNDAELAEVIAVLLMEMMNGE